MRAIQPLLWVSLLAGCGQPAPEGEHATIASPIVQGSSGVLLYETSLVDPWCGAVLIEPDLVLTAAHCVKDRAFENLRFTFDTRRSGRATEIRSARIHPRYADTFDPTMNLAVLTLASPIEDHAPAKTGDDPSGPLSMMTSEYASRGDSFEQTTVEGTWVEGGPPDLISVRFPEGTVPCHGENGTPLYARDRLVGIGAGGYVSGPSDGIDCDDVLTFVPVHDQLEPLLSRP